MRKTIVAVLAGIAVVAGGFFAGTLVESAPAIAREDTTATVDAPDGPFDGRFEDRRGPGRPGPVHDMIEAAVTFLGMEADEVMGALADGGTLADLTDDVDGLVAAIVDAARASLDEAVAAGRIDAERAAEIAETLEDRVTTFVTTPHEGTHRPHAPHHLRAGLREAAGVIGVDVAELVEGLRDGMTVAEVAEANGVDEDTLVDALVDSARARITDWVHTGFDGHPEG